MTIKVLNMDWLFALIIAQISAIGHDLINLVLQILAILLFKKTRVYGRVTLDKLDRYIADHGYMSAVKFSHVKTPDDGYHGFIMWSGRWPTGIVFVHKYDCVNNLYIIGRGFDAIKEKILGDPARLSETHVSWMDGDSNEYVRYVMPLTPHDWQEQVVLKMLKQYDSGEHVSALVCGPPGCGKSSLGLIFAAHLKNRGTDPQVYRGIDFTTPGCVPNNIYCVPTLNSPVILVLDEIDTTINFAEDTDKNIHNASPADTQTRLLNLIDRLSSTDNLIIIYTSNKPLSMFRDQSAKYQRYVRIGRTDLHCQVNVAAGGKRHAAQKSKGITVDIQSP